MAGDIPVRNMTFLFLMTRSAGPLPQIGDWKTHISSHYTNIVVPGQDVMIVSTRSWVATSRQIRSFSQIDRETNEEIFRHPPSLVCLVCSYCIDNVLHSQLCLT